MKKNPKKRQQFLDKKNLKKELQIRMHSVFMDIWLKRRHYSELSGIWLGNEALTVFFHHILPKSRYPEAMLDEENIILLTFKEHQQVENFPNYYKIINEKREELKIKYDRST